MPWILLALLSHISWGTANIADKYIIGNRVKNVYVYQFWLHSLGALSVFALPFFVYTIPDLKSILWLTLAGVMYVIGVVWYFKGLAVDEVSRINIWWNLIPVFCLLIGGFWLHEWPNQGQLIAMAVLLVGSIVGTVHYQRGQKFFSPGFIWITLASLEFSFHAVINRFVSATVPLSFIFIYLNFVRWVTSLFFFLNPSFRRDLVVETKKLSVSTTFWVIVAVTVDYLGILFNQWALKYGQAALVLSIEGFQALFVFFVSTSMAKWRPELLSENIDRKNMTVKIVAVILIILGIIILAKS